MIAPSTQTAIDRMTEAKRIGEEIVILKGVRERTENDVKQAVYAVEQARNRLKTLEIEAQGLETAINDVSHETSEFIRGCTKIARRASEETIELLKMASSIEKAASDAIASIEKTKGEAKVIHETVVRDNEYIDRVRTDLNIYYERLKKHFETHLPDQKIIL